LLFGAHDCWRLEASGRHPFLFRLTAKGVFLGAMVLRVGACGGKWRAALAIARFARPQMKDSRLSRLAWQCACCLTS
jgi:hypothetical protein